MLRPLLMAALATMVTAPTIVAAQSLTRRDIFEIPVYALNAVSFEVIESDGAGGTQLWCAAGIYAREVLGQRSGSLYIEEGRGPAVSLPGRVGVRFTTQPVPNAFSAFTQGVRRTGQVFSINHAYALCNDTPNLRVQVR